MYAVPPEPPSELILVLTPTGCDAALACAALAERGFRASACTDLDDLCRRADTAAAILLAEEALAPPGGERFAEVLARQPPWSDIPLIVCSSGAPSSAAYGQTVEAIRALGNVTLLDRPLRIITLVCAVQVALRARSRQLQVRDLLDRLEASVHDRDRFLAMLSHELRNPLAVVVLALQILERKRDPDPDTRRRHDVIARQIRQLTGMVDELLDVSRVTSGRIHLKPALVDLAMIVQRCVETALPAMRAEGHLLELTHEPVHVVGDAVRLEQIVTNLLTNACKYTPRGGHVRVSLKKVEERAVLEVADTGVGIPPGMLERIFETFTQVDASIDRCKGGLGVGLSVVRALVALHGGTATAFSPGAGRGSVFTVSLPRVAAPDVAKKLSEPDAAPPSSKPCSVVLVEDNDDLREGLKVLLESDGHSVGSADDGPSGVATVLAEQPDAVLLDIGLPGLDGYEVARAIRAALGDGIFLAAVSGYSQPADQARAKAAGFNAHLTKPVDPNAVEALLRGVKGRACGA